MRVAMYYANADVRTEEMARPQVGRGELLLKVMASGICGSDVMEWYRADKVPLVLGHEVAGEVVEVGEGVERFVSGDRVAVTHHVPCNTCGYCLRGAHTMCETLLKETHFHPGGFAEYLLVPEINVDRGTFAIPSGLSYDHASFMEPLACVLRGQKKAGVTPGQTVLVMGAGISGLMHLALAKSLGAGLIIAADTIPFRLDMAQDLGAHHVFMADDDLLDKVRELNQGRLADLVIICFEGFLDLSLRAVERGGTVLFFAGTAEGTMLACTCNDLFWRTEVTLTSSYAGAPQDCYEALHLIAGRGLPIEKMITHRLPLERAQEGFLAVANPVENDSLKVIIRPHG